MRSLHHCRSSASTSASSQDMPTNLRLLMKVQRQVVQGWLRPSLASGGHQCIATKGMRCRCIRRICLASLSHCCVIMAWSLLEFPHQRTTSLRICRRHCWWNMFILRTVFTVNFHVLHTYMETTMEAYNHNLSLREIEADVQMCWRQRNMSEAFLIWHWTSDWSRCPHRDKWCSLNRWIFQLHLGAGFHLLRAGPHRRGNPGLSDGPGPCKGCPLWRTLLPSS